MIIAPWLDWEKGILLTIYVDEILIIGFDENTIESVVRMFKANFTTKDIGKPNIFLWINIGNLLKN